MLKIENKLPVRGYIHKKITMSFGPTLDDMTGIEFDKIKPVKGRETPEKIEINSSGLKLPTGILGKYANDKRLAQLLAAPVCCGEGRLAQSLPMQRTKNGYELRIKNMTGLQNDPESSISKL